MEMKLNQEDVRKAKRMLAFVEDGFPKALYRAYNKTADNTKTEMVKFVRDGYNYKATALRKRIKVNKCKSYTNLNASVVSTGGLVHLTDIAGRRFTKKGIVVDVKKTTGRHLIPHAFEWISKYKNKNGVEAEKSIALIRKTVGGKMVSRRPVEALYASHPETIYGTKENWPKIQKIVDVRLKENIEHEVDVVLGGIA